MLWIHGRIKPAFTLVELLVVIGIIAVLIAILLPALGRAREQAKTTVCLSNQRQVVMALLLYANDNKNQLPPYGYMKDSVFNELSGLYWWQTLAPYVSKVNNQAGVNILRCPSEREGANRFGTYGVNYGYSAYGGVFAYIAIGNFSSPSYAGSTRVAKLKNTTFLTADCIHWAGPGDVAIYSPYVWPLDLDTDLDAIKDSSSLVYPGGNTRYNHFDPRHGGGAVCSFIDGSARKVLLRDWITNKDKIWGNKP